MTSMAIPLGCSRHGLFYPYYWDLCKALEIPGNTSCAVDRSQGNDNRHTPPILLYPITQKILYC